MVTHTYDTRSMEKLRTYYRRLEKSRHAVNHFAIKFYNILPDDVKTTKNLKFKNLKL